MKDLDFTNKRVILRADLNVPAHDKKVIDTTRITRLIPTIELLRDKGAKTILISHFGRPKGEVVPDMSLEFLAPELEKHYNTKVTFHNDCIGEKALELSNTIKSGEILLLENLRFHKEEEENNKEFASDLAKLGDIYINDAFACSHREHASVVGISKHLPSYPGLLLEEEVQNLESVLKGDKKPITAIVGGKKISTKFAILDFLSKKVDNLIIGGAMANTFIKAQGFDIGESFNEPELVDEAGAFLEKAKCNIYIPTDTICAEKQNGEFVNPHDLKTDAIKPNSVILDLGSESIEAICKTLDKSQTVVWNGPVGFFEDERFATATFEIAHHIANLTSRGKLTSVAGGGDVIAAIEKAGVTDRFSYISTAGGAFLEWLEGKELPGIAALK